MGVRSGEHIKLRGGVYHYRRAVPADCRRAFGAWEHTRTLETTSRPEAKKFEKEIDIEFEARIAAIRAARDPHAVADKITQNMGPHILMKPLYGGTLGMSGAIQRAGLTKKEEQSVHEILADHGRQVGALRDELMGLFGEISEVFSQPVDPVVLAKYRRAAVSLARSMVDGAASLPSPDPGTHMLAWAWDRWIAQGNAGHHTKGSEKPAERHWKAFLEHSELVMLGDVKRHHLTAWRDTLIGTGELADNSINQRLSLVKAILRTGWREANLSTPDLMKLNVKVGETDRKPWTRDEILKALSFLKPKSWQAWLFVIGLTTSVRLGEPVAAMVDWWKRGPGFIEMPRRATKKRKFHAIPIIEMLHEPFDAFVQCRSASGYIFDCPRPPDPDEPISNFASRSLNRFLHDKGIDRVFHELRDTWINEARHCPDVKKEIWEIISGHSAATVSDMYGGEKPEILLGANEKVCRFLTEDAEMRSAVLRLVDAQ
jgi:hypothetical protein